MQEERSYNIKRLRKTGEKKEVIDSNGEIIQPGSRILKGYWGDWLVFGGRIPGFTLKLKIRIIPSGSKIRLINPLMTPDNNWEDKKTSVHIKWGDGQYDKIYKKKINSGRFNRDSDVLLEHTYTANVGDELWLEITSIEPLVPYGCEIVEMLGRFPYDRYDLNMDRDGHYCGLFGVDQYVEDYPELNKLYGAGRTITKVSSDLLDNWRNIGNMNRMFEGWGLIEIPEYFFKWYNEIHPDPNPAGDYEYHNAIVDTCASYYRTFADCVDLTRCGTTILASSQSRVKVTEEMFDGCVKLKNVVSLSNCGSIKNASKMYRNCKSLVVVDGEFLGEKLESLETIESIFDGCSSLRTINWDRFCAKAVNLINAKAAFRGTAFTEVAFNMRAMTKLGTIEFMYADMIHLREVVNSFSYDTASEYAYWRHSHPDTLEYAERKLRISHLFENSGDRTLGMIIPKRYFQTASTTNITFEKKFPDIKIDAQRQMSNSEKLHLEATHIFAGAYLNKYNSDKYRPLYNLFNGVFGTYINNNNNGYNLSHIFDGLTCVNCMDFLDLQWIFGNCYRIHYMEYAYANIKNRIGYINSNELLGYSNGLVKSIKGLLKNDIIDHRFSPYNFWGNQNQNGINTDSSNQSGCIDYSEMFAGVTYKYSDYPIDFVVHSYYNSIKDNQVTINMRNMFAGSNIKCYRPIHPNSDRKLEYDCTNLIDSSPAPKEWMLNGFHDVSDWQPKRTVNPLIYWIECTKRHQSFAFGGDGVYVPKKIDWGDGSTSRETQHIYAQPGVYKITITDDVFRNPDVWSSRSIFKIDGELPYNAEFNSSYSEAQYISRIQEVGPNVCCLAKKVYLTNMCGYIDPMNFRYGNNTGLKEGVTGVNIGDPSNIDITFSADFVLVDKTITLDLDIVTLPLFIGKETYADISIGIDRVFDYYHHVNLNGSNLLFFPQSFFTMKEAQNMSASVYNYNDCSYSNLNYLSDKHFSNIKKVNYLPRLTTYFNLSYERHQAYRFHPTLRKSNLPLVQNWDPDEIGSYFSSPTSEEWLDLNDIISDNANKRDTRKPKVTREYVDFELENIPDEEITFFRIDSLPNGASKFRERPLGKVKIQIFLYNENEDEPNPERDMEFDNVLPNLSKIKSRDGKAVLRVWSDHIIWPSCKRSIVGIYGILTNKEGDMWISEHDFYFGDKSARYPGLAPNIRHISEDLLWGLQSTGQFFSNLFTDTQIEEIPMNLLNHFYGYSLSGMFENCKNLRVVPDRLIKRCNLSIDKLDTQYMFAGCSNIEYVFKPFAEDVMNVYARNMFNGCKTYAFRGSSADEITRNILHSVSVTSPVGSNIGIQPMVFLQDSQVPVLDLDNDTIMCCGQSHEDVAKVATYLPYMNLKLSLYKNNPQMLFRAQNLLYNNNTHYDEPTYDQYNLTSAQLTAMMRSMHALRSIVGTSYKQFVAKGEIPPHNMLFSNKLLNIFAEVLAHARFNYTPNLFFLHQEQMRYGNALLHYTTIDKAPYEEYVSATHLPDRLGRPIYIGGGKNATRYRARNIDKMLRHRNDFMDIRFMLSNSKGDMICPKFENHIVGSVVEAFSHTSTYVPHDTFVSRDTVSPLSKVYVGTYGIFWYNTAVDTDCRVFHVWKDVSASANYTGYEFANTTNFLHPPKDMFSELTKLTTLNHTFENSNIRELPDCNPRIQSYPYFAAGSKVSLVPEHWFKYSGTETLDIRYAFDNCSGLIIIHKIIDPTVTVPVRKYSSLRNARSIIGDDPEIFEGVNTKLDGTDKSLVKVIPEEDMFKQTIDVHDPRWTLSVKALGMETIGHEPVQDDNLFMVIWGDGSSPSVVSYRDIEWEDYSHKYDAAGRYQVLILSTQWCCFVNSPQELSSKYTTYSIDGMLQNTTCEALAKAKLSNMFGYVVEVLYPTLFDKCKDVATVKAFTEMFKDWRKLKTVPKELLAKMTGLEDLTGFLQNAVASPIHSDIFKGNPNLKTLDLAFCCMVGMKDEYIPATLFANNHNIESLKRAFAWSGLTQLPRTLLKGVTGLKYINDLVLDYSTFVLDDSYDDFLATNVNLETAGQAFGNCIIKAMPPNIINRNAKLHNCWAMFALWDYDNEGDHNLASKIPTDEEWNNYYVPMNKLDSDFRLEADFFPASITNTRWMFGHRNHLKGYAKGIFDHCTKLSNASVMFLNTGITMVQSDTFKTQSGEALNLKYWLYKDKRLGKTFYSHYIPRFINPAINVTTVYTDSSLLGAYGTMTEAELFAGINTNPTNIHSLYVQEFEPATFKLKMNGDGTFITMKPITASDVTFTDLTYIQWGDGTEDLYEENIPKNQIQNVIKHIYKTPGTYTITVGAKYCLVPIVDTMPEAYQIESVVFPENINQVKSVSIGGKYGVGHLEINRDNMYIERESAEVEMSLVPRPYYVGETYTVDVTVDLEGLDIGETTTLEVNVVRDTSDPFERLEIGGVLGFMEGITTFPKIADMPELQYSKWVGTETFFSRNTQLTSFNSSFMNLNYEFRIADKVFWPLINLGYMDHCFWNTKLVIEPGFAPDFNKNTKLRSVNSMFRGGRSEDIGKSYNGVIYIPEGTPLNKVIWKVDQTNYQPFASLNSITDYGYICCHSDITYTLTTNLSKISNMIGAYKDARSLTYLRADFFRTLNSSGPINVGRVFADTYSLTSIQPAPDGKSLLEFTIGNNQTVNFSWAFAGSGLPVDTVVDIINKSSFINTTASGTNIDINNLFTWCISLKSTNASALRLAIPSRTGTLDMTNLFSYDSDPSTTIYDKDVTMLYNIKPGAITIAASGSPNVIVDNMFDHCYADATISDAHECFVVTGDDANFTKAKKLADDSALNTLTVMTTTVVPK